MFIALGPFQEVPEIAPVHPFLGVLIVREVVEEAKRVGTKNKKSRTTRDTHFRTRRAVFATVVETRPFNAGREDGDLKIRSGLGLTHIQH